MDVKFDSTSGLPNTYDYINNLGANPTILIIITIIILAYYFIFTSLGIKVNAVSNSQNSGGGIAFIEALMWSVFILLLLLNGSRYFFGINVTASIQKILSNDLINNSNNDGITTWIENALKGKISSCYKRMSREWTQTLLDDPSFTDSIPSNKEDLIKLILAQPTYISRKKKGD